MNFDFTEEQKDLWDLLGRVGLEKFRPHAFDATDDATRPTENMKLLGELGILGLSLPVEVGGADRPDIESILAIERLTWACPTTGRYTLSIIAGPPIFLAKWGTDDQKNRFLPPAMSGEGVCSISLSEPGAGSALTDLTTSATVSGDICRINGTKTFCTGAGDADWILVFVRFGPGPAGIGAVIVERDAPGFTMSRPYRHMGGQKWHELWFNDAEIPVSNILFDGNGFRKLMGSYSMERCAAAAWSLGIAQIALDMAIDYAKERKQFGRPISDFQFTQGRLADMYLQLEQARLLMYKAVVQSSAGLPSRLQSSAAKVAGTEAAAFITDQAMQVFGGSGMSKDMPLEWLYRCARPYTVAGGTSDIHRSMIAGELVGRRIDHRSGAR
jgi:alkylation response protein AidB-like acyl-CoA dehydrogenase